MSEAVVDLLGALSYAQLSGFEALAADAQMTPHLRAKMAFARRCGVICASAASASKPLSCA